MKKQTHRLLSLMLSLILVVGMIPGSLMTAHAATPTVTWNNQTFTTQQNLAEGTVLELVGNNTINIDGGIVPDHNDGYYGIDGSTNLTIQGNGTLTINMKNITVPSGYDIDRLRLIGLQATNLTIEGNVKIVINIESTALGITGISGRTISVEDAANLDITVANTRNGCDATGIYASRWASLTSTGTTKVNVSVNSTTTYELGDGILVDGIDVNEENNGNLTIKKGTVNVLFDNNASGFGFFGAAIKAGEFAPNDTGSLLIEDATINTTVSNNGKQQFAIEEGSKARATNTNTLVVKNSTLNLGGLGLNGGLISANNGMHLDNSTVTVNCQINNAGHALQAHSLKISGGKVVSLTTYGQYPVWVSPYYGYIEFDLTEGGKFIAMGTQTGTYDMNYVKLGADNNVTSGSVDYTNNYNSDTTIGFATAANNKFVVEYGSTGGGETPEPNNNVNVGVTAPVAGEYPNSSATIDNAGFTIEEIRWCDNANGYATLDGSVPFVGGNKYQCVVFLEAKEGYDLASIEKVTINGNTATYGTAGSAEYYYYDFTATGGVAPSITGITIDPTSAEVTKGNTQQFTATVTGEGEFDDSVQWSVSGGSASTIDANGLLTVGAGETATELTVIAKAAADTTKTATATVTVAVPNVITATVTDINVTGTVDTDITVQEFRIYVDGDTFGMSIPANITDWFKNIPTGLIVEKIECAGARLTVRVSGTPTVASDKVMQIVIPAEYLTSSTTDVTVTTNANAKYSIVAGSITPPTEYDITVTGGTASVGAGTPVDKATEGTEITLTVDESAIPAGKVFDKWKVVSGGVTVTDGKFTMPANAVEIEATYKDAPVVPTEYNITVTGGTASANKAVAGTVITLTVDESAIPAGKVFDKWEVVSGGVTVTDGKFTMPANAVEIKATYKDAPVSHTCDIKPVAKDEPSCTEGGKEAYYKCEGCGKFYEDALGAKEITDLANWGNLPKLGHTESDWKSDKDNHWKECTVTACGVIIEDSKAAHKDDNKDGKCDVCEYNVGLPTTPDNDKPNDNPQTGDNSNMFLWIALLFISGAGVVATTVFGKKKFSVK